ncbi:low molecular weight protein-tyrosine-phosphatase [Streptococcus phocae subsp. phocae]
MKKVCFVCLGNICRSPMAEFVMKRLASQDQIEISSRATSSWEQGNLIHQGTQSILNQYGIAYDKKKTAQQIDLDDLRRFDYIIGMDHQNVSDLKKLSQGKWDDKIHLFNKDGVPDPWYTGDFEETYQLVMQGCRDWLSQLKNNNRIENVDEKDND